MATVITFDMMSKFISGIVLAAGESKRMGVAKQLLPFGKTTLLERVVDNALGSNLDEVIVVLGYRAEEIAPRIGQRPVKIAINPDFRQGMSSSLKCGLAQVSPQAEAIMILLGDQPFVGKGLINLLMEAYPESNRGIIVPVYRGRRGNPVIFDIKYRGELLGLRGDVGGKGVVENHPEDLLEVEVKSAGIIADVDQERDYKGVSWDSASHGGTDVTPFVL